MRLRQLAVAFLFNENREVLFFQKQAQAAYLSGYLVPVGGHLEEHEINDPQAACVREIAEETGLTLDNINGLALRYIVQQMKSNREISVQYIFTGQVAAGSRLLESAEGRLEWVDCRTHEQLNITASTNGVLDHYLATGIHNSNIYVGTVHSIRGTSAMQWSILQEWEG